MKEQILAQSKAIADKADKDQKEAVKKGTLKISSAAAALNAQESGEASKEDQAKNNGKYGALMSVSTD